MARLPFLSLIAIMIAMPAALAAEVSVIVSGTEYQGGPAFEISVGKTVIGTGTVDPLPAKDQASAFSFNVPDNLLATKDVLRIRLTNDAYGGPGKDRNLFIFGVAINEQQVLAKEFSILSKGQPVSRKIKANHIDIWSSQEVAVANAPDGGWLATPGAAPQPASLKSTGSPDVVQVISAKGTKPAVSSSPPNPTAKTVAKSGTGRCDALASIIGIETVSRPLSATQLAKLVPVIEQSKAGYCRVELVGYASQGGNAAANLAASQARAQLVLAALKSQGGQFADVVVTGAGATSQFGNDDSSNRRVEVKLSNPG